MTQIVDKGAIDYCLDDITNSQVGDVLKAIVQSGVDITPALLNIADTYYYKKSTIIPALQQLIRDCSMNRR